VGLAGVWVLFGVFGSNWRAILALPTAALLAALLVRLGFPETSGRALEEIAPEPERSP